MIDILKLYQTYGISYQLPGHKHVRPGWIGIPCPFCTGNPGNHLGYCQDPSSKYKGRFICWRCGPKKTNPTISTLLRIREDQVWQYIKPFYNKSDISFQESPRNKKEGIDTLKPLSYPPGTKEMAFSHRNYLKKRQFDPEYLEKEWNVLGTGPAGDYKHRIIIPIHFHGRMVSYQGRDITDKSSIKYKPCYQVLELKEHQNCLYGLDKVKENSIVVVEGVTDVWRLGSGAVATFGIKYSSAQVALLLPFDNIFIIFDPEEQAQEQALKLSKELVGLGKTVEILEGEKGDPDPGNLSDQEAKELMKELIGGVK